MQRGIFTDRSISIEWYTNFFKNVFLYHDFMTLIRKKKNRGSNTSKFTFIYFLSPPKIHNVLEFDVCNTTPPSCGCVW